MKFNWDNIVFQILGKLVDCVWVSILWVICCIPVFTIGASTTALYYTVHKSIRGDRGYTTRTFFGAFRDNFKAATLPYLIWLAVIKNRQYEGRIFLFLSDYDCCCDYVERIFIPIYCKI